jgi:hypothetical protein
LRFFDGSSVAGIVCLFEQKDKFRGNMGNKHFLLEKAFIFPKRTSISAPEGCEYFFKFGAWFKDFAGHKSVLMKCLSPGMAGPRTKKADIETGEDLKGE